MSITEKLGFDSIKFKDRLSPYAQVLLEGLIPILKRLNFNDLSANSSIEVEEHKGDYILHLEVIPSNSAIPPLGLLATQDHCILSFAESEQIESHRISTKWEDLVCQVLALTEQYLNGITVIERYNKNHELVVKEYFYGLDTEGNKDARIGIAYFHFTLPNKIEFSHQAIIQVSKVIPSNTSYSPPGLSLPQE